MAAYKADVSFLEKLALGAIGTRRVFSDLASMGHSVVELERGSLNFKIWKKIKIKRVRVPDLLCLSCATRVESRAKTNLEVSMSHSRSDPERGWDFAMRDDDLVAFVQCQRLSEAPTAWEAAPLVQYFSMADMRKAYVEGRVSVSAAKGAQEGFEIRVTWPTSRASAGGEVLEVNDTRIKWRRTEDGRILSVRRSKGGVYLDAQVAPGNPVMAGQFLTAPMPVRVSVPCSGGKDQDYYAALLASSSLSDRYTAVKALGRLDGHPATSLLTEKVSDDGDHIYVRLEAAAGLMTLDDERGQAFIESCLVSEYLEQRLEAVIILGEIEGSGSYSLLRDTLLDSEQHAEIRAGAAWSIGELAERTALDVLVECFAGVEEPIRVEAARALLKLARSFPQDVAAKLGDTDRGRRAGVAWALSRLEHLDVARLTPQLVDDDARRWVAFVVGMHDPARYVGEIENLRDEDAEVYFAVTVLWQILQSWVFDLDEHS